MDGHMAQKTEFQAVATTYVGNFTGNCLIHLNGQAIVVLDRGLEINRWPYNCIRQFRAENESGKFSFVSGRRGPYGVAEYNFRLLSDSLIDLQSVLTEFTGAQFSAVAPGSGTDQQPLQPQQPLPPYHASMQQQQQPLPPYLPANQQQYHPHTLPHPSRAGNSYTSLPHHMTMSGRNDSSSSMDSVFSNSPVHGGAPKLPPRPPPDHLVKPPMSTTALGVSGDETALRGLNRARASTSGPQIGMKMDTTYSTPRPALPPPRREAKEPSPEVLVATSSSYEEAQLPLQQAKGNKPVVPKKKKTIFGRLRGSGTDENSEPKSSKKSKTSTSPSNEHIDEHSEPEPHPQPLTNSKHNGKSHTADLLQPVPEQEFKVPDHRAQKESPYDHLPSEKAELDNARLGGGESGANSPIGLVDGKSSPNSVDGEVADFSDLDVIRRSSPTVNTRSKSPQSLKKAAKSVHGRRSPVNGNKIPKSNTLGSVHLSALRESTLQKISDKDSEGLYNVPRNGSNSDLYQVPKSAGNSPPSVRNNGSSEDLYNVPRNTSNSDLYQVPRSAGNSPPSVRNNGSSEDLYNVPRNTSNSDLYQVPKSAGNSPPSVRATNGVADDTYANPRCTESNLDNAGTRTNVIDDGLYKVPNSVLHRNGNETCDGINAAAESLYNVPRSGSSDMLNGGGGDEGVYNVPRDAHWNGDSLYNRPRAVQSHATASPPIRRTSSSSTANNYESIEIDTPLQPRNSALRPARSFESLSRFRVNVPTGGSSGRVSPPTVYPKAPKCEYVDIDLEKPMAPAKNAPLPPLPPTALPSAGGGQLITDSVYAEISEEAIARGKQGQYNPTSAPVTGGDNSADTYVEIPSTRPGYAAGSISASGLEGMAKAKELAEEEGYELFQPIREQLLRPLSTNASYSSGSKSFDSTSPPASALLEKYNINIETSRPRPYSESDVLDDGGSGGRRKLGPSLNEDLQSDEYVIVTGPDRRPKPRSATSHLPPGIEDDYEFMNSASINLSSAAEAQYSAPNSMSCVPQPQQSSTMTRQYSPRQLSDLGQVTGSATPPLPPRLPDFDVGTSAGIDIDTMSPIELGNASPVFHRQASDHSLRSEGDLSATSIPEESEAETLGGKDIQKLPLNALTVVKTMSGSPMDRSNSTELKNLTRSLGNVLEKANSSSVSPTPSPPSQSPSTTTKHSSSSTTHHSTPPTSPIPSPRTSPRSSPCSSPTLPRSVPLSPAPGGKRHDYINCTPGEEEGVTRSRTVSTPKNKRPRPLPRMKSEVCNN